MCTAPLPPCVDKIRGNFAIFSEEEMDAFRAQPPARTCTPPTSWFVDEDARREDAERFFACIEPKGREKSLTPDMADILAARLEIERTILHFRGRIAVGKDVGVLGFWDGTSGVDNLGRACEWTRGCGHSFLCPRIGYRLLRGCRAFGASCLKDSSSFVT